MKIASLLQPMENDGINFESSPSMVLQTKPIYLACGMDCFELNSFHAFFSLF